MRINAVKTVSPTSARVRSSGHSSSVRRICRGDQSTSCTCEYRLSAPFTPVGQRRLDTIAVLVVSVCGILAVLLVSVCGILAVLVVSVFG